jgi:hypothetical protein
LRKKHGAGAAALLQRGQIFLIQILEEPMKNFALLSLMTLVLASCGKKEEFKYNLTEGTCSTGDKTAESKSEMCNLLRDSGANNGCANSLRKQKFEQEGCGTWPTASTR